MSGHGQLSHAPDGGIQEVVKHDMRLLVAELVSNGLAMFALLKLGLPQVITAGQQSDVLLAAKLSAMYSGVAEAKRALARMGIMLPAAMYGGTGGGLY